MPRGPCPDCKELIAADIWLVASVFRAFGVVFVEDEFVDKTAGAIIRAAIDRNAKNSAVSEVRRRSPRDKPVSIRGTAPAKPNYSQSMLNSRAEPV